MPGFLLYLALQAAVAPAVPPPQTSSADTPERFSILVPVSNESCVRHVDGKDIVVCGNPLPSQTLPYPEDIPPDGPIPSNPYRSGTGALAAAGTPCPISRSCVVGFGPPLVPMIKGAADLAKKAFAKKPNKTGRVAIPLDDTPPSTEGKLLP